MIQFRVSKKLFGKLTKHKINPHDILSVHPTFHTPGDKKSLNKIDLTYTIPFLENRYRMTSSGTFSVYREMSHTKKILEIHYDSIKPNLKHDTTKSNEYQKNKIQYDIEFLKLWMRD